MTSNPGHPVPGEDRVREAIRELPAPAPDPEFLARLKADFVEGRLEQPERFRRPSRARWAWVAVPVAAAALLAIVLGRSAPDRAAEWIVLGTSGSGTLDWAGTTYPLASLETDAELPPTASPIRVEGGWIEVGRPGVVAVRLNADSDAVLAPPSGEIASSEWELRRGELQALTGPGFEGQQLAVTTPEGRVEVTGTAFAVFRDDAVTCVCVLEGVVRIGVNSEDLEEVVPGYRKVMFSDGRPPAIMDIMPEHRAGLEVFLDDVREIVEER